MLAAVQQHFRHALEILFLSRFRLQEPPCASAGESCPAAAARRPRSFRETSAPVEHRPRILGALMQILVGLGTVSNGCEAGDRYPLAPEWIQALLELEEPETWAGPSTSRARSPNAYP